MWYDFVQKRWERDNDHHQKLDWTKYKWLPSRVGARWRLLGLPPRGNWPGTNTSRPISSWATATKILWRPATTTCSAGLFLVYQILSRKVCCLGMLQLPSRLWGTHVVQLACAPNFKRWLGGAYFAFWWRWTRHVRSGTRRSWTRHIMGGTVWHFCAAS